MFRRVHYVWLEMTTTKIENWGDVHTVGQDHEEKSWGERKKQYPLG